MKAIRVTSGCNNLGIRKLVFVIIAQLLHPSTEIFYFLQIRFIIRFLHDHFGLLDSTFSFIYGDPLNLLTDPLNLLTDFLNLSDFLNLQDSTDSFYFLDHLNLEIPLIL